VTAACDVCCSFSLSATQQPCVARAAAAAAAADTDDDDDDDDDDVGDDSDNMDVLYMTQGVQDEVSVDEGSILSHLISSCLGN